MLFMLELVVRPTYPAERPAASPAARASVDGFAIVSSDDAQAPCARPGVTAYRQRQPLADRVSGRWKVNTSPGALGGV